MLVCLHGRIEGRLREPSAVDRASGASVEGQSGCRQIGLLLAQFRILAPGGAAWPRRGPLRRSFGPRAVGHTGSSGDARVWDGKESVLLADLGDTPALTSPGNLRRVLELPEKDAEAARVAADEFLVKWARSGSD